MRSIVNEDFGLAGATNIAPPAAFGKRSSSNSAPLAVYERSMRILLIEDDAAVAETVRRSLATEGHNADLAPDGRTARNCAAEHVYDAILLDLNLPDASGFDLIGELRKINPKTPVVMLTGRT
jgi:DNA-binding NtrC family response regulator